jgi:peptidyl-Lys metalloendopeptidase
MRVSARLATIALALAFSGCAPEDDDPSDPTVASEASALVSRVELVNDWLGKDDSVEVRWTLVNEGLETVYLPRWQTPAAALEANVFEVVLDGAPVRYVGKVFKRAEPTAADLVGIEPGHELSAVVDLSSVYETGQSGEYAIQYHGTPAYAFTLDVSPQQTIRSNVVSAIRYEPFVVADANLGKPVPAAELVGAGFRSCSSSRKTQINAGLQQADTYAVNASNYLNSGAKNARYTTWFGTHTSSRYNTVKAHFANLRSTIANKSITFDCTCTESAYAYVYPNQPYVVYLCGAFWPAPTKGTDSKAGTIIHELSHFNVVAATDDNAYGQGACKNLARSSPSQAVDNADSHEYFAENTPAQN